MKALTLQRPWPVAMFYLKPEIRKDVENRSWTLPKKYFGQRVAIHAGSKKVDVFEHWLDIIKPSPSDVLELLQKWNELSKIQGIIGTVIFSGWHYAEDSKSRWAEDGCICWQIEDPIALPKPIPCKGAQGLWDVPLDIERQILEEVINDR